MIDITNGINVLSLFDGMSCGQIALEQEGIKVNNYFASEIDKYAIQVCKANYPNTKHVGDVRFISAFMLPKIDLIIGGSPCQGFSFAGKQLNFEDPRSKLFFEFVRLLKEVREHNPDVRFMLENVTMKKEYQDVITEHLGVKPIFINSALVSAQNRKRIYWTNIGYIAQPGDKNIYLKDVLESAGTGVIKNLGVYKKQSEKSQCLDANYHKGPDNHGQRTQILETKNNMVLAGTATDIKAFDILKRVYDTRGKSPTLNSCSGGSREPKISVDSYLTEEQVERGFHQAEAKTWKTGNRMGKMDFPNNTEKKAKTLTVVNTAGGRETNHVLDTTYYRKLTPVECERLQTVPDNYTNHVSTTQRYRMLGNGWTSAVIRHIFKSLKPEAQELNNLLQ